MGKTASSSIIKVKNNNTNKITLEELYNNKIQINGANNIERVDNIFKNNNTNKIR